MKRGICIAGLAWSFLFGPAYNLYLDYHFTHSTDTKSYLEMSQGNLAVNPYHRYRMIVPTLAAGVAQCIQPLYHSLWDFRPDPLWTYRFGFLIVNSIILAGAASFIFFACRAYGASLVSSLIAMLCILSSRWAHYMSALPLTDSLYLFSIAMAFYSIKAKHFGLLLTAAFLGPLSKESFFLFIPLFYLGPWNPKRIHFILLSSGMLFLAMRFAIDFHLKEPAQFNGGNMLALLGTFGYSLKRLLFQRLGEKFSVLGIFTVIGLIGFTGGKTGRQAWMSKLDKACLFILSGIIAHILLSGDVGRMLFLAAPVWAVGLALILEFHPWFVKLRQGFKTQTP